MINNRGQSLVLFVLIIPVLLLIIVLVADIGKLILLKQELNDINYIAIDYALDNMDNEQIISIVKDTINKNKKNVDLIDVSIDNNKIYITTEDKIDGILLALINTKSLKAKSSYVGYIQNDKKIIERVDD